VTRLAARSKIRLFPKVLLTAGAKNFNRTVEFIQELDASLESGLPEGKRGRGHRVFYSSDRMIWQRSANGFADENQSSLVMVAEATMPDERNMRSSRFLARSPLSEGLR